MPDPAAQPIAFLRAAIAARKTILISGGTSTGKTTFLNSMLGEIPAEERVMLVEDTPELRLPGANGVGLVAVKGELGEATDHRQRAAPGGACACAPTASCWASCAAPKASASCARSTPAIPGSFSTIHANSLRGALDQLALMVMQTGIGLSRSDTIDYAASVIDVIVQLGRVDGRRQITAIANSGELLSA